jgi:hypothetical protein
VTTNREVLAKLETTVPLARKREEDFKQLADQGFMAGHAGQDRTRQESLAGDGKVTMVTADAVNDEKRGAIFR